MTERFTPADPDFAARVRDNFGRQGLMAHLGAELVAVEPGRVVIEVPFRPQLTQQNGFFHAGVTAAIADTAGGYSALTLMPATADVLTVEFKLNLMAPAAGQRLRAVGQVVRAGRRLTVTEGEVFAIQDGVATPCARMLQTMMRMDPKG